MTMNNQGRPSAPGTIDNHELATISGDRGLDHEEPLIFEIGRDGMTGVDLPNVQIADTRLGGMRRRQAIGLPGLSEPEVVRHYVRLSRMNYAIDAGLYPLGSCTMKHNPRLNEKMARLPGFGDLHPMAPQSTVQGALEVISELMKWLTTLTGMPAVAMSPKAGAHGELCGLLTIRAAIAARGETRRRILVPESAHGTNPATAAFAGFTIDEVKGTADGRVDMIELEGKLGPDVAAIMLTNPNTCGLFERDIRHMADATHRAGAYFYCDGANFNAIAGRVRPGDLGIDAMHINLHKTFSTPHGGGGPGAGPVVLSRGAGAFRATAAARSRRPGLPPDRGSRRAACGRQALRPHERLSRPDGHVRARAGLHAQPWPRRRAPGQRGRGSLGQLYPRVAQGRDERALRRRTLHA
jgi:glycine dehydrogenase subunit 2